MRTVTSTSLLEGLKTAENTAAWERYVSRYRPVLVRFARSVGLRDADAEDVAQATLLEFSTAYQGGRYQREKGRLRSWLFGIARNQVRAWVRRRPNEVVEGAISTTGLLDAVPDAHDPLQERWDQEWRAAILRQCLEEVRREVEERTFDAFQRFALKGESAREVARDLDLTENAVFQAKRRVLRRARELVPLMEDVW